MKPIIDKTKFSSITIEGKKYKHDVLIRLGGKVEKRNKKLSKVIYGTSHTLSIDEAKFIYEKGAELLIIGSGKFDSLRLSEQADEYFKRKKCQVKLLPTQKAIQFYNQAKQPIIALFHVTC